MEREYKFSPYQYLRKDLKEYRYTEIHLYEMSLKGVLHKIAWVNLNSKEIKIEEPADEVYTKYLGGYGLGAYYLFTRQRARVDPIGPENTLGLTTGPLTGTQAITGNRFTAVAKSPKTGGWGDTNCGGKFGPALKQAGLDAIFFTGVSEKPVYVLVEDGKVTLHDALLYWGLTCSEAEEKFMETYGKQAHAAIIGPAGERVSALAAIVNDKGRAAGRSGLGMVMGSKRLKGVVALATGKVQVAEEEKLKKLRKRILSKYYQQSNPSYEFFHIYGTPGALEPGVLEGDTPVQNWRGWKKDFRGYKKIGGDALLKFKIRPYGCWMCPTACGAYVKVPSGPYAGEGHRPEYETLGAFGSMCLNDNLESICHLNNICNDYGMDTISTGATIAFAIECYEKSIINKEDTRGIELTWGNHEAIVRITEQMAKGEGFGGEVLGDGIKKAVERIGEAAKVFAIECGGEELPMHDPRFRPGMATVFVVDATPGRHTQYGSANAETEFVPPELGYPEIKDRYTYSGKGETHKYLSSFGHVVNSAGLCMFGSAITPATAVPEYLTLAMGMKFTMKDILEIGERIANLRIAFNLREGIRNKEMYKLPKRVLGQPPLTVGPTKGVMVDNETQIREYFMAMGWNPETGVPKHAVFERLGLDFALEVTE
jgi:aldehyde:ferredoxin oxidoreductase